MSKVQNHYEIKYIHTVKELEDFLDNIRSHLSNDVLYPRIVRVHIKSHDAVCSQCGRVFTEPREARDYCSQTYCGGCKREENHFDNNYQ